MNVDNGFLEELKKVVPEFWVLSKKATKNVTMLEKERRPY
jgi:hypothetical protein